MFIFNAIPSILEFHRQNKFEGSGISKMVGILIGILNVPSKQKTRNTGLEIRAHQWKFIYKIKVFYVSFLLTLTRQK